VWSVESGVWSDTIQVLFSLNFNNLIQHFIQ
jgi:hypothetical protein